MAIAHYKPTGGWLHVTSVHRIAATVDAETKKTLTDVARRNKISVSALLRVLAMRLKSGEIRLL